MKKLIFNALVFLAVAIPLTALANPTLDARPTLPQDTSVVLRFSTTYCTGTVVGEHTILTDSHCMNSGPLVAIDSDTTSSVLNVVHDGKDHALVQVTATFEDIATIHQYNLPQTQGVRFWGNPGGYKGMYRKGTVMGFCQVPMECLSSLPRVPNVNLYDTRAILLSTPGYGGDSGSGVFDAEGNVVTVVSAITRLTPTLIPMVAFDMQFTPEQLESIQ